MAMEHSWNGLFWGFFGGPNSPKYGPILLKFLPEVVLKEKKKVLEESLKSSNFFRNRSTQSLHV